jgi:hypothetical protein
MEVPTPSILQAFPADQAETTPADNSRTAESSIAQVCRFPVRAGLGLMAGGINVLVHGFFPGVGFNDAYSRPVAGV